MPNLRFLSLAVWEFSAFNAQTFMGSRDPGHAHFCPFDIQGLNYELLQSVPRRHRKSASTLPLEIRYVGASFLLKTHKIQN